MLHTFQQALKNSALLHCICKAAKGNLSAHSKRSKYAYLKKTKKWSQRIQSRLQSKWMKQMSELQFKAKNSKQESRDDEYKSSC